MTGSLNPKRVFELFSYKIAYAKEHPEELRTTGIRIFCGSQGSGKTLSAVQYVRKLLVQYPRCILVTNTDIAGIPENVRVYAYDVLIALRTLTMVNMVLCILLMRYTWNLTHWNLKI